MDNFTNKYYIRLNEEKRIIKFFSTAFEDALANDICVGEGIGSQFRVDKKVLSVELQEFANIENGLRLINVNGIYILKYENNQIIKISDEELEADIQNIYKLAQNSIGVL